MPELVITRGLPASGKTRYAREWVNEDPANRVRVNRDDLRAMSLLEHSPGLEQRVRRQRDLLIDEFLCAGKDVICDDTNLPSATVKDLIKIAKRTGSEYRIVDLTHVPPGQCCVNNAQRELNGERFVDEKVIWEMYIRYLKDKPYPLLIPKVQDPKSVYEAYVPDETKPTAFIFDIDGTVAHMDGRSPYDHTRVGEDQPDPDVIRMASLLHSAGHHIIFLSGRKELCFHDTFQWLKKHLPDAKFGLMMRGADDNRRDAIVKYEMFDKHIRHHYYVQGVFDDRDQVVKMWREVGLKCYQVGYGDF